MNTICTIYLNGQAIGTIISIPTNISSIENIHNDLIKKVSNTDTGGVKFSPSSILIMTDEGLGKNISCKIADKEVPDESLRKLSSNEYIVFTNNSIIHKDKVLYTKDIIPSICHWKAIPYVPSKDLIDYKSKNKIDKYFIDEGFARELKNASYVVIPTDWNMLSKSCTPYDLLIAKIDRNTFHPISGRKYDIQEEYEIIDDRYIILNELPTLTESCTLPSYTYNTESLTNKYNILQDRLQLYGRNRVKSINASLRSVTQRLDELDNQYMASSIYNDVSHLIDKISLLK